MKISDLFDLPVEKAVTHIAFGHLDNAATQLANIGRPGQREALHDFRVAIRRTRSVLRAYRTWLGKAGGRKVRRRLADLASATNAGRDAEVQIEWLEARRSALRRSERAGLNWLLRRLREEKRNNYATARQQVRNDFAKVNGVVRTLLAEHIAGEPTLFRWAFGTLLQEHAQDLFTHLTSIRSASDKRRTHEARLAGKRLRYLLEPIAPALKKGKGSVNRLKQLQDLLGELNDVHILAATVASTVKRVSSKKTQRMHELALEGKDRELARERRRDERLGLVRIAQLVRRRRDELYETIQTDWLGGQAKALAEDLQQEGVVLTARGHLREIERKYLLSAVPPRAAEEQPLEITQGWLPGQQLRERLRRSRENGADVFYRTVKLGSGLERIEVEEETTSEIFSAMWPLTDGSRVLKRRYRVKEGKLLWEIDEFTDRELVIAEVELPSTSTQVTMPEWLVPHVVKEVTGDRTYENVNLAR